MAKSKLQKEQAELYLQQSYEDEQKIRARADAQYLDRHLRKYVGETDIPIVNEKLNEIRRLAKEIKEIIDAIEEP